MSLAHVPGEEAPRAGDGGSSDDLVPAIAAGDAQAFARFVAGAEPRLRASLRAFAARVDTEAVVQESLLRVWQVAPRFIPDGRPNGFLRLAMRIARNLAISELRRDRLDPTEIATIERIATERGEALVGRDRPADPLLRRTIEDCRGRLPAKPAAAIAARMASAGDETDQRLAERLGMRLNTFLQNITRARRLLADCLRRRGVDLSEELR